MKSEYRKYFKLSKHFLFHLPVARVSYTRLNSPEQPGTMKLRTDTGLSVSWNVYNSLFKVLILAVVISCLHCESGLVRTSQSLAFVRRC
jgi:hypothetical protein